MANAVTEELRTKIVELRDKGLLPKKYAHKTVEIYEKRTGESCTLSTVYNNFTGAGNRSNLVIMEILIELAEETKEAELLRRANKVLED